jgi:hypothetical protein
MTTRRRTAAADTPVDEALQHFARALLATVMQVHEEKAAAGLPVPFLGIGTTERSRPTKPVRS